jgi:hypothetical protein
MAAPPSVQSRKPGLAGGRVVGLVLVAVGTILLVMPELDQNLRPAGGVAVLLGVVVLGSHFMGRLKAELLSDGGLREPTWRNAATSSDSVSLNQAASRAYPPALDMPAGPSFGGQALSPSVGLPPSAQTAPAPPAALPPPASPPVSAAIPTSPVATPAAPQAAKPPAPQRQAPAWGPAIFDAMSSRQFEAVCEALFAQGGFETRCQSHGASGGVTIWLHSRHAQQGKDMPVAIAQCKQWKGQPIGVKEMHPLLELMENRQLKRGTYATSSTYTENARKFAKYNGINALDQAGLLALIAKRTPQQQRALLMLAFSKA